MKVALLDRRFGSHGHGDKDSWKVNGGSPKEHSPDNENTYAFMNCWDEAIMTGPLEKYTDYSILKDYDLVYIRLRTPHGLHPVMELRRTCQKPVIIVYCDEWVNFNKTVYPTWITEVSKHVDAMTCGFGKKYQKEAFNDMGIGNFYSLPYAGDVHYWKKWYKPWNEKGDYVTGMWHIRSFRGQGQASPRHKWTFWWFKQMQDEFGVQCKFFTNFDGRNFISVLKDEIDNQGVDCELIPHVDSSEFRETMSKSKVFFEEYLCPSFSRATVVSAAVGTPSISTDMNEPSTGCFPDLTFQYPNKLQALKLGRKLLDDNDFWKQQSKTGYDNSEYYYYPAFKERLMNLYEELLNKRQS